MSAGLEAVEAYLAPPPEGRDSYPECGMKGATVRAYLGGLPAFTLSPTRRPGSSTERHRST